MARRFIGLLPTIAPVDVARDMLMLDGEDLLGWLRHRLVDRLLLMPVGETLQRMPCDEMLDLLTKLGIATPGPHEKTQLLASIALFVLQDDAMMERLGRELTRAGDASKGISRAVPDSQGARLEGMSRSSRKRTFSDVS